MIKFGPSGLCQEFALTQLKTTAQASKWLADYGVDCFEYSFGRGVILRDEAAKEIGNSFLQNNIEISVHAPYFINLATQEEDKAVNNHRYIFDSLQKLRVMQGNRCVFHPGSPLKLPRNEAVDILMTRWQKVLQLKEELGYGDLILCPEVMGKKAQLGDLDEIIAMCKMGNDKIIPCIDFGHYNSRNNGCLKNYDDFKYVIDKLADNLGDYKTSNMHIHFSKIEYTKNGELRHLTFEDNTFGPDFEPLLKVISDYKLTPYIICESAGIQTRDSKTMKDYFYSLSDN